MNLQNIKIVTKKMANGFAKKSPSILTGISVASTITSVILSVKATLKADEVIREKELQEKTEIVKECWKLYIPTALSTVTAVACAIGSNSVNCKRNAALASAYALSADALKNYKEKAEKIIGKKKSSDIRDEIAKDEFEQRNRNVPVVLTNNGNVLIKEMTSGQFFRSSMDTVQNAINQANRDMIADGLISLNDVYYYLGIAQTSLGSKMCWRIEDGLIDVSYGCCINEENEPCLTLEFSSLPVYRYDY